MELFRARGFERSLERDRLGFLRLDRLGDFDLAHRRGLSFLDSRSLRIEFVSLCGVITCGWQ